jgi:hypothetical protein
VARRLGDPLLSGQVLARRDRSGEDVLRLVLAQAVEELLGEVALLALEARLLLLQRALLAHVLRLGLKALGGADDVREVRCLVGCCEAVLGDQGTEGTLQRLAHQRSVGGVLGQPGVDRGAPVGGVGVHLLLLGGQVALVEPAEAVRQRLDGRVRLGRTVGGVGLVALQRVEVLLIPAGLVMPELLGLSDLLADPRLLLAVADAGGVLGHPLCLTARDARAGRDRLIQRVGLRGRGLRGLVGGTMRLVGQRVRSACARAGACAP